MKFDVVVGNPPYNDSAQSGNALWSKFVIKSLNNLKEQGYLSMIVPGRWVLPGYNIKKDRIRIWDDIIRKNSTLIINLGECSRHFTAGSNENYFSYFLTRKSPPPRRKGHDTNIITTKGSFHVDVTSQPWLPFSNCNELSISIVRKIHNRSNKQFNLSWKFDRTHNNLSEIKTEKNNVPVFMGNNKCKFSDHVSANHNCPKVIFKLGRFITYEKRLFIDYKGNTSYNSAYIVLLDKDENVDFLKSKVYRYLASCLHDGSGITAEGYRTLPKLDSSKSWTDEELYEYFGLSNEEIDYIERAI